MNQDSHSSRIGWDATSGAGRSWLARIAAIITGAVLLGVGLMFSAVILVVAVVLGLGVWGWLWWRTRDLRREMRSQMEKMQEQMGQATQGGQNSPLDSGPARSSGEGVIIDGDFIKEAPPHKPGQR